MSWTLEVVGADRGEYTLAVEDASEAHSITIVTGTTNAGVQAKYNLNLNSGGTPLLTPQDQTPLTTIISLDGTKDLNGRFLTPVRVSLLATDNNGGVGVRNTEYSIDNGEWKVYDEPFMLYDGVHQLLYRSSDHVNNVEATQLTEIRVDTVPPVDAWVDQPEYIRIQSFVAHFSGYDPEPGSGLANLGAIFNNQPIIDG